MPVQPGTTYDHGSPAIFTLREPPESGSSPWAAFCEPDWLLITGTRKPKYNDRNAPAFLFLCKKISIENSYRKHKYKSINKEAQSEKSH